MAKPTGTYLKSNTVQGFTILLSCTSIGLTLSLMHAFTHPRLGWMVISVQTVTILRAVFSYVLYHDNACAAHSQVATASHANAYLKTINLLDRRSLDYLLFSPFNLVSQSIIVSSLY